MRCPNAIGNPFIHLRLGQANYELQEIDRAKDEHVVSATAIFSALAKVPFTKCDL